MSGPSPLLSVQGGSKPELASEDCRAGVVFLPSFKVKKRNHGTFTYNLRDVSAEFVVFRKKCLAPAALLTVSQV